ncbi:MAG: hypothetical protein LBV06_07700 [Propionibacteriaceae bacterium]|jgi:hypothetical protein|nr:hypothetical protein [Propionibacteriaceae bacterium]
MSTQPSPESANGVPPLAPDEADLLNGGNIGVDGTAAVTTYPLTAMDPAKIGDFWPTARLVATDSGVAYVAQESHANAPVMVILLSQGASEDPAARDRLAGQVDRMDIDTVIARGGMDQDRGRMGAKFRSEADDPHGSSDPVGSPWVALAFDQTQAGVDEARRILDAVDFRTLPAQGSPTGPDYRLHWSDRVNPGVSPVWPLPWPGRRERGGRLSLLASWLLMLLLAAIAILIAILIFSQAPQVSPPPPIPSTQESQSPPPQSSSPSEQSGSPSPSSGSPSPSSGSPSPSSGSPSPSSGSASPSEQQSGGGEPSGQASASPTPPSRL